MHFKANIYIAPGFCISSHIIIMNDQALYVCILSISVGSISPSMVIPTTTPTSSTSSIETTTSPCPTNTVCPPMMSMVDDDDTGKYVMYTTDSVILVTTYVHILGRIGKSKKCKLRT